MRRLLISIAVCPMLLLCTSPVVRGDTDGHVKAERAYSYGSGPRRQLVAYRDRGPVPRGRSADRRPGVVILHGGFWFRDRPPGHNPWAQRIADAGTAVFDVDYRRNVDAAWPAQRADVLSALRWIRRRAHIFRLDPHRLVLLGSSAGGQLATDVGAYGAGRERVAGVVGLSPVADPYRAWRAGARRTGDDRKALALRTNAALLAGCEPLRGPGAPRERCRRTWRDMIAARHASGADDAPMLLIHSRHDFVPASHSRGLRAAERRRGMAPGDITVLTAPGAAHGGRLMRTPGVLPRVLAWIEARTRGGNGSRP